MQHPDLGHRLIKAFRLRLFYFQSSEEASLLQSRWATSNTHKKLCLSVRLEIYASCCQV